MCVCQGVRVSVLCRDLCWLLEEVLFRHCDVGFGGSVLSVVFHALSVLRPHLLMAAAPPSGELLVTARPDPHTLLTLSRHSQLLTHVFITEAVGGELYKHTEKNTQQGVCEICLLNPRLTQRPHLFH